MDPREEPFKSQASPTLPMSSPFSAMTGPDVARQRKVVDDMLMRLALRSLPFGDARDQALIEGADHLVVIREKLGRQATVDFLRSGVVNLFTVTDEPCSAAALRELAVTASALYPFAAQGFTDTLGALVGCYSARREAMPLTELLGVIREIAEHTNKAAWIILKHTIPRILALDPSSPTAALDCASRVCRRFEHLAPKFLEYGLTDLLGRTPVTASIDFTLSLLDSISVSSGPLASVVVGSLGDFLTCSDGDIALEDYKQLAARLTEIYRAARHGDHARLGAMFAETLQDLPQPVSVRMFESLLDLTEACGAHAPSLVHLLAGACGRGREDTLEPLVERLERLKSLLPSAPTESIGRFVIRSYQSGREVEADSVVESCVSVFGADRTTDALSFIGLAVTRFTEPDLQLLVEQLPTLRKAADEVLLTQGRIDASPATYLALRFVSAADDVNNPWNINKARFDERWAQFKDRDFSSVIKVPQGISFSFTAATELNEVRVRTGAHLDEPLIRSFERKFSKPSANLRPVVMGAIKELCVEYTESENFDPLGALVSVSSDPGRFSHATKIMLPLLTESAAFSLPALPRGELDPKSTSKYLYCLQTMLSEHVPTLLRERGLDEERIRLFKEATPLARVQRELEKFTQVSGRQRFECRLIGGKNLRGAFIDQLGETCVVTRYGQQLDHPQFEPIVLACPDLVEAVGCVYVLKGVVGGAPALIVAGIEPRLRWVQSLKPTQFLSGLYSSLDAVARANALHGGVYISVGAPAAEQPWTDDGRMAQYEKVRACMVPPGSEPVRLPAEEQIDFPKGFKQPIKFVVKV